MRKLMMLTGCFIIVAACSNESVDLNLVRQQVIDSDRAFSKYSEANGFAKALAAYADKNAIKLNPRQYAVFGIAQLQKEAEADSLGSSQGVLTWEPKKVHVAAAGDMAAAFGDWNFTFKTEAGKDTTLLGNYITVWKKQEDGSWKFVLDGGNGVPGPTTDEMLAKVNE